MLHAKKKQKNDKIFGPWFRKKKEAGIKCLSFFFFIFTLQFYVECVTALMSCNKTALQVIKFSLRGSPESKQGCERTTYLFFRSSQSVPGILYGHLSHTWSTGSPGKRPPCRDRRTAADDQAERVNTFQHTKEDKAEEGECKI